MQSYFFHDSNTRNYGKILNLRRDLGAEGYGIYFMLLERLRENRNYMSTTDYDMLSFDLRADPLKIKKVVEDYGLFLMTEDGKKFFSVEIF